MRRVADYSFFQIELFSGTLEDKFYMPGAPHE
jgi:hypothetical protein